MLKKWGPGGSVLLFLTLINLFNYLDRYILVALSPAIKRDLLLSDFQVGLLTTAFMVSYFAVSPLFGVLGDRGPRLRLMSLGVGVWSLATALCGFGRNAFDLLTARLFVGVGEAAYGSISPSLLRDLFPRAVCGRVFAVFFMAIPVGSALGYLLGGILEESVGWRAAFFVAGVPGLLLALALLFLREPKRGAFDEGVVEASRVSVREMGLALWRNSNYMLTLLGYCAYTFALGGIAVWIPHYIERYLGVSAADGNKAFGAITVVAGLVATVVGGAWADRWARRSGDAYLKLSALSMFVALPIYLVALGIGSFGVFCALLFVLEFFLFLSTSPINAQIVNCVSPYMRATANAVSIFAIHLLGDGISSPLVGLISDHSNLLNGMLLLSVAILVAGLVWAWKVVDQWEAVPWPAGGLVLPRSQCHRGFHASLQENTLDAFRAAVRAGAAMVELDVRLSRDDVAVVIHDSDLRRVAGREGLVRSLAAAELAAMARAPSLKDVLLDEECRGLLVNVELKHLGSSAENARLVRAVASAVQDAGAEKRVLFSSFNPLLLREISRILPDIPRALLATGETDSENKIYLRKMWLAFLARPHMLNYDGRYLTEALAASLRARRVPFALWTVNEPEAARKYLAMGAESIISDVPKIV